MFHVALIVDLLAKYCILCLSLKATTVFANISQFSALHLFFSILLEGELWYGEVVDHRNGTYSVALLLPWEGQAQVYVRLEHSNEVVQVLKKYRESSSHSTPPL